SRATWRDAAASQGVRAPARSPAPDPSCPPPRHPCLASPTECRNCSHSLSRGMGSKDSERIRGASRPCAPPGGPLMAQPASDHRPAVAERNLDGILAAAGRLLEALVERAVRESVSAIEGAEPARGP